MRVERAVLREIGLRLKEPFSTRRGTVYERRVLLVTLFGAGYEGWGECVAGVDASWSETVDGSWSTLAGTILPRALGRSANRPEAVVDIEAGGPMARAAVEMAAWDLVARAEGVPLSRKLGGTQTSVLVGVSVGLQRDDAHLAEVVSRHLAEGYARVKLKIEPGRDVATIDAIRARFPQARLWADANAGYTLDDLATLRRLDAFDLELLEQPLAVDDLVAHARLQQALKTRLCLDESIVSADAARRAIEVGACRVMNLKPGRLGGHTESILVHDLCRAHGVPIWCGGMLETGIGRAHNLALASLPGFTLPGDISASRRYWQRDIVVPAFDVVDGRMAVPNAPGVGVVVDADYVRAVTVREKVIE